jgi:anti-sigma B factor antagonist
MPDSANYEVSLTEAGDAAVVHVSGEIDLAAKADLHGALTQAAGGERDVIVDLSRTTFMDSTALKALVDAWRSQTRAGLGFALRNPSREVCRTLRIAGLEDVFPTTTTND